MTASTREMASYWVPMAIFGIFTTAESYLPPAWYPWVYLAKICAVLVSLVIFPRALRDIRPSWSVVLPSVLVGVVIFAQWILLDRFIPYPHLGTRVAFNPFAEIPDRLSLTVMLAGRFFGLVVLVPIIEETLWRNLGLRYFTNQDDYRTVNIGTFSATAFWIVAVASALTHPEWLVALIAGILFAVLVRTTKSMFAAVISHSTANLALGVYIVATGEWQYW